MERNVKSLIGFTIGATDGEIGKIKEFYFDDKTWTIRYLIVETGNWLFGRKVLLSPQAVLSIDKEKEIFSVNLTREQIKSSPDIDTEKPVSRQEEIKLYEHYPWISYWGNDFYGGWKPESAEEASLMEEESENAQKEIAQHKPDDTHLRSTDAIIGSNILAKDGEVGEVDDFLMNPETWKIDLIVVETGHWFSGKKVLLSPRLVQKIDWLTSSVTVDATVEKIKQSPEYNVEHEISDAYIKRFENYYMSSML